MNYKQHYDKLIKTRKSLDRKKNKEIYYESHHIIPKSCGGTNDKENLVLLTFKEHFVAHLLLTKIYTGNKKSKMIYALWRMCNTKKYNKVSSSSQYKKIKQEYVKNIIGHIVTEETRKKISEGNSGKICSKETKEKLRQANLGKKFSEEIREKMKKVNPKESYLKGIETKRKNNNLGLTEFQKNKLKEANSKKIICLNNNKIYSSIKDACIELGLISNLVSWVCNGKRTHTKGYKFSYINE